MNSRITKISIMISLVVLASIACGVSSLLPGGTGGVRVTNELWSDVPKMDGLGASDLEMPLMARIIMQTMVSTVLSGGTGNGDYAAFTTSKTAADVQAFYTNERMTAAGWAASEQSTCINGNDQGYNGVFCVFYKENANDQTGLVVLASPDENNAAQTNVFFFRIENQVTPTP
jgi:hypothetical protein